jgi:hypothetical protein
MCVHRGAAIAQRGAHARRRRPPPPPPAAAAARRGAPRRGAAGRPLAQGIMLERTTRRRSRVAAGFLWLWTSSIVTNTTTAADFNNGGHRAQQHNTEQIQPNPPLWPANVHVFSPETSGINATVQAIYQRQRDALYGEGRTALLFQPGTYAVDVPVGYYTSVHGLGAAPKDVSFIGPNGVHQAEPGRNLIQFWRSAENLANRPASGRVVWSVSQAAPLRRMVVDGDLVLGTAANTQGSGGFISGVKVRGQLNFTMQQQWIARNCELSSDGTSFFNEPPRSVNFVFVGTHGAPPPTESCTNAASVPVSPSPQMLVVDQTPVSVEKPYIRSDSSGRFQLVTPRPIPRSEGVQWDPDTEQVVGFERVFVADNRTAVADINAKLAEGLHVILTPGIYSLSEPIRIGGAGSDYQVLLGLGLATLVPLRGGPAIEVADAPGVRIAGLLLQAGPITSKALISVGGSASTASLPRGSRGSGSAPIVLTDVFARVGGPDVDPESGLGPAVSSNVMMEINASNVILDNVWLWRADVENAHRVRDCNHSLVVNGDNVTVSTAATGLWSLSCMSGSDVCRIHHFDYLPFAGTLHIALVCCRPTGWRRSTCNRTTLSGMGRGAQCTFTRPSWTD